MGHSNARSETPDITAVAAVATEYFQSWFAGDGERMRAVLHPALSKRTPQHPGGPGLTLDEDTAESMVSDTAQGPRTQYEAWQDVHVVDVAGDIATVIVRSQPFDEYLHLGRFDGRWLIINALYVRHDT
jgi:Putative lumazine-binding